MTQEPTFAQRLIERRNAAGMKQADLARCTERSGNQTVSKSYLNQLEKGVRITPSYETVKSLAECLGADVLEFIALLERDEDPGEIQGEEAGYAPGDALELPDYFRQDGASGPARNASEKFELVKDVYRVTIEDIDAAVEYVARGHELDPALLRQWLEKVEYYAKRALKEDG